MNNVQNIINKLESNDFSIYDLEQYLESSYVLIKTNAILAVLRERIVDESIIEQLKYISQNIHHEPKVIGEWNTGHYAMATLNLLNTEVTREIYANNISELDTYVQESINNLIKQISYILI